MRPECDDGGGDGDITPWAEAVHTLARVGRGSARQGSRPAGRTDGIDGQTRALVQFLRMFWGPR